MRVRTQGSFSCAVGQHISAVWSGNGEFYGSTIVSVDSDTQTVVVDWDDGGTDHREVQLLQTRDDSGTVCMDPNAVVECPPHSTGTNVGAGDCTCAAGFRGVVTATASAPYYAGGCVLQLTPTASAMVGGSIAFASGDISHGP